MPTISFNVPAGNVAEVKAAIDHHVGVEATDGWTNQDYLDWIASRIRANLRHLVFKYREAQQADIDRTDPTEA